MNSVIELLSIRFENVRGFYDATLPLDKKTRLMVGRNHAGKTSTLLLLRWLINEADPDRLWEQDYLNEYEKGLLLPARSARHRARRITLEVKILDGRKARKYECTNGIAKLRVGISVSGGASGFIQIGEPTRSGGTESDEKAVDLLRLIQKEYAVVHIPSARDARSSQFKSRFETLFKSKISEKALHSGQQAGSTTEYRKLRRATDELENLAQGLIAPMLDELKASLPLGMLKEANLNFKDNADQSVLEWIVEQLSLKLITGEHDNAGVRPEEVGAGLQSTLDIAAASVILGEGYKNLIVAVEEPEAFLHPSLQREIARKLLSNEYGHKTIVSSHSPILVSETRYNDLIILAERTIRTPREREAPHCDIHTALLAGEGAELVFSSSVLLVEGNGDKQFFDTMRRRLAPFDDKGMVDNMYVVQVGGKESFGPWIRLLNDLNGGRAAHAFKWLVVPDGDAVKDVRRAFNESDMSLPSETLTPLSNAAKNLGEKNYPAWRSELGKANSALAESGFPLQFLDGDLERAIFDSVSDDACQVWAEKWKMEYHEKESFIKMLGSKSVDGKGGKFKSPFMRRQLAEEIKFAELTKNIREILRGWLMGAGIDSRKATSMMRKL